MSELIIGSVPFEISRNLMLWIWPFYWSFNESSHRWIPMCMHRAEGKCISSEQNPWLCDGGFSKEDFRLIECPVPFSPLFTSYQTKVGAPIPILPITQCRLILLWFFIKVCNKTSILRYQASFHDSLTFFGICYRVIPSWSNRVPLKIEVF